MRRIFYDGRPENDGQFYWFQDNRTGCEKQTVYFERIRQLDSELITKEQKHLVGAMERLKQLRYPRRKPIVLNKNWDERGTKYKQKWRFEKHEHMAKQSEKSALSLNAKQMEICVETKDDRANLRPKFESPHRSMPQSTPSYEQPEQQTIQIDYSVTNIYDNKPHSRKVQTYDMLLPSLPCIPNVGHRTNIENENKLRILELANGEFQKCRLSDASNKSKKRLGGERRFNSKPTSGKLEEYTPSNQSDTLTPVLTAVDETPGEKEFSKSLHEESVIRQEIGKSETQTRNFKCDVECETSNARQPPPTRKNSHITTPEPKDNRSSPLCVAIKSSSI
ncbi:Hypothetical predicted protein [Paramuricea clavata]|uniref:Uncharacterized protein n=1 Tax=Paramuricea clavata TaxID=317549 RepID=A0A6S7HDT8_PARCT|nr:Hypothetical predicted protein [Paramuricea clavata]